MIFDKFKRKRRPLFKKFKAGDVFWADVTNGYHLIIILDDHSVNNHQECIPICNFSGTEPHDNLHYVIPIGSYILPNEWWTKHGQSKPQNWIICQPKDCIKAKEYSAELVVGNIRTDCPQLFTLLCNKTRNCIIAPRLNSLCNCEGDNEIIIIDDNECECNNVPN